MHSLCQHRDVADFQGISEDSRSYTIQYQLTNKVVRT